MRAFLDTNKSKVIGDDEEATLFVSTKDGRVFQQDVEQGDAITTATKLMHAIDAVGFIELPGDWQEL